jgi:hypothetical protein
LALLSSFLILLFLLLLIRVIERHCTTNEEVIPIIDNSSDKKLTRNQRSEKKTQKDSQTLIRLNKTEASPSTFSVGFKKKIPFAAQPANMELQAFKQQKGSKKTEEERITGLEREVVFLRQEKADQRLKIKEMVSRSKINIEEIRHSSKKRIILSSCYVRSCYSL